MSFLAVPCSFKPNSPLAPSHFARVEDDSTPVFSTGSALFSAMARTQIPYFQWLAHSFPSHGGVGIDGALALSFAFTLSLEGHAPSLRNGPPTAPSFTQSDLCEGPLRSSASTLIPLHFCTVGG